MSTCPLFKFFIPGHKGPLSPQSPLWQLPLSGKSADFLKNVQVPDIDAGPEWTIGDYFSAARSFLEAKNGQLLAAALSLMAGKTKGDDPIEAVELFLEKHGAFYHPLRVAVCSKIGRSAAFVLNGAVSRPGLALIEKEYQLLESLGKQTAAPFTPRVFGAGIQFVEISNFKPNTLSDPSPLDTSSDKKKVGFFLGEWFEGFREFHISRPDGDPKIAVWSSDGEIDYLSLENAAIIYEQIAHILTVHYNVDTGEQIFPWHHAAGDFIVGSQAEGFPVKLITVRGYAPLMEFDPEGIDPGRQILPPLLFFFLNLTLRTQMDRLDGVGSLVFLGEEILRATVTGFLRGLEGKTEQAALQEPIEGAKEIQDLKDVFVHFMAGFSRKQIAAILTRLVETWPINVSERSLAGEHLESHSAAVYSLFKNQ
jgi:hypothetical protein